MKKNVNENLKAFAVFAFKEANFAFLGLRNKCGGH